MDSRSKLSSVTFVSRNGGICNIVAVVLAEQKLLKYMPTVVFWFSAAKVIIDLKNAGYGIGVLRTFLSNVDSRKDRVNYKHRSKCTPYITSVCRNRVLCRIFFRLISIATAEPADSNCLRRLSFRWEVWTSRGSSILFVDLLLASRKVSIDHTPLTDGDAAFFFRLLPH